jgi:hypothetical protein
MRTTLIPLTLLAAACSSGTPTAPNINRARPSFAIDLTEPPAPTNVSAVVVQSLDANRVSVRLTWTDNSTFLDEFNTCAAAVDKNGASVGGGCAYAADYDAPAGSTGVRSGDIIVGRDVASVSLHTFRRFNENGSWYNVAGPWSESVAVTPITLVSNKGKKKP